MTWTDPWGIDRRWIDAFDAEQAVSADTVSSLRTAIGTPPDDLEETAPLVVRPGASLREATGLGTTLDVRCEDGSVRQLSGIVPEDFPLGYHRIRHPDASSTAPERWLIVSPGRCWLPDGWRAWGWTVQLYAVRSASSWGIGDLGDLREIRDWAHGDGAGFLLVNPLHAVAPTFPQEASPYLPATRRFRNPLYLRVSDVPGADLVDLTDFEREGRALSGLPEIDRDAVWRVKRAALQAVFDAGGSSSSDFLDWRADLGQPLEEFATWCALADSYGPDFNVWPVELRRPDGAAVAGFHAGHRAEVDFHAWLQWALAVQIASSTEGLTVLQDLPIGVDGGGADAWAWQDQLAGGVRIGAPPDIFNPHGQDWGSPPLIPWRMRADGYQAFVAAIRATMAATGGLRIDHVMGLFRLWWVPEGGDPSEGAYVRYPSADLLDIVALESHRAQAIVVGEDLGTVEPGVREALAEHAILSYRLLWFEEDEPEEWPAMSMAAVTTHDLPTVAGLWSGSDLAEQLSHQSESWQFWPKPPESSAVSAEHQQLVDGDASLRARLAPDLADDAELPVAVEAAYELLARSPATLLSATLEDAVAEQRRPNMPGVADRPNWRLPLPVRVEALAEHPTAKTIATVLSNVISRDQPSHSKRVKDAL